MHKGTSRISAWTLFQAGLASVAIVGIVVGWQLRSNAPKPDYVIAAGSLIPLVVPPGIEVPLSTDVKDTYVPASLPIRELALVPGALDRGIETCVVSVLASKGVTLTRIHMTARELRCMGSDGSLQLNAPISGAVVSHEEGYVSLPAELLGTGRLAVKDKDGQGNPVGASLFFTQALGVNWR